MEKSDSPEAANRTPMWITGVLLFFIYSWVSSFNLILQPGTDSYRFETAGWFIFGFPTSLGMGLLATYLFVLLAKKTGPLIGWSLLILLACLSIGYEVYAALPTSRISRALNIDLPEETQIYQLRTYDTFNAGTLIYGTISCTPELFGKIRENNNLSVEHEARLWMNYLDMYEKAELPDYGDIYRSELLSCYFDSVSERIYFYGRSRPFSP